MSFVIFALLLLVLVPVMTGSLIAFYESQLSARVAQPTLNRQRLQPDRSVRGTGQSRLDAEMAWGEAEHDLIHSRIARLREIQRDITGGLTLLGLLACCYTYGALRQLRHSVTELDVERAKLAAVFETVNRGSLDLHVTVPAFLAALQRLVPYDTARLCLLPTRAEILSWDSANDLDDPRETELLRRLRGKAIQRSPVCKEAFRPLGTGAPDSPDSGDASEVTTEPEGAMVELWSATAGCLTVGPSPDTLADLPLMRQALECGQPQTGRNAGKPLLAAPIVINQDVMGALQLEGYQGSSYEAVQLLLLQQAVGQLASAVQNAHLYAEANYRAEQLAWSMQETQHRIKNNLQVVTAILDMYLMDTDTMNVSARDALSHALREVQIIAAVHDLVSQDLRVSRVNVRHLMERLVPLLLSGPAALGRQIDADIEAQDLLLPSKLAASFALAANEIIANAIQHGGRSRSAVALQVRLRYETQRLCLYVRDDGPGFPADFARRKAEHVGLNLVEMLIIRDHRGKIEYENDQGAHVKISIPFAISQHTDLSPAREVGAR